MQRDIPSSVLQSADCRTGHTLYYLCYALTSTLMCCVSGSLLHHSCILAGDFGHGSVTVTARGLQVIRLLRNMQKTISSTFPVYHQLSVACTLPRFSKKTQIWPSAGQVQTQMGQMGSRSLSQSDWQSAAPQGSRGEIPFAGGSPHIKDLNWSYVNLSHHPLQQFIKFPKLFPGIWPQMAELAQGREGLGHTVSVMTAELMGLRLLSCYLLPIRMNPLPSAKQLLICYSTSLRGARLRACLTVNSSKPRTGGFMTCIRTLLEHPLRPPTPWLKQDRRGEAGFLFGKCFFVQRNEYQPNGTNELQGEGSWAALEW